MITELKMYGLKCDNCGQDYETGQGYSCMNEPSMMREDSECAEWHNDGDKDYCSECHEFNDEDELIIDESRKSIKS